MAYYDEYNLIQLYGENGLASMPRTTPKAVVFPDGTDLNDHLGKVPPDIQKQLDSKQDILVAGENIKTINGQSLLGEGNLVIQGGEGGSTVEVTPVVTSGTELAKISVDGDIKSIYAPTVEVPEITVTPTLTEGTEIATISVDGERKTLYAPNGGTEFDYNSAIKTTEVSGFTTSSQTVQGAVNEVNGVLNNKADASDLANKQDALVSGTNIKTINGESILGAGNIEISGGSDLNVLKIRLSHDANYWRVFFVPSNGGSYGMGAQRYFNDANFDVDCCADIGRFITITVKGTDVTYHYVASHIADGEEIIDEGDFTSGDTYNLINQVIGTDSFLTITSDNPYLVKDAKYTELATEDKTVLGSINELNTTKQPTLVSGTTIKTINGESLLGEGNLEIQGGGATYTAGENIQISETNVISATDTVYTAGENITISEDNVISATGGGGISPDDIGEGLYFSDEHKLQSVLSTADAVKHGEFIPKANNMYSTTKTTIGTWIDGATIYRQVIPGIDVQFALTYKYAMGNVTVNPTKVASITLPVASTTGYEGASFEFNIPDDYTGTKLHFRCLLDIDNLSLSGSYPYGIKISDTDIEHNSQGFNTTVTYTFPTYNTQNYIVELDFDVTASTMYLIVPLSRVTNSAVFNMKNIVITSMEPDNIDVCIRHDYADNNLILEYTEQL